MNLSELNYIGNLYIQLEKIEKIIQLFEIFKFKEVLNANSYVKSLKQHRNKIKSYINNYNSPNKITQPVNYHTDRLLNYLENKIKTEEILYSFFIPIKDRSSVKISHKRSQEMVIKSGCLLYVAISIRYRFYLNILKVFNNNWDYINNMNY